MYDLAALFAEGVEGKKREERGWRKGVCTPSLTRTFSLLFTHTHTCMHARTQTNKQTHKQVDNMMREAGFAGKASISQDEFIKLMLQPV